MENYQFFTLVGMLAAGFAWTINWLRSIDTTIRSLESRVSVVEARISILDTRMTGLENRFGIMETRMGFIERLLEMMGIPSKALFKERNEP